MKFSIKDFFSKYERIRRKLRIWSYLLKKSLMENFIFCAMASLTDWRVTEQFDLVVGFQTKMDSVNSDLVPELRKIREGFD